MNTNIWKLFSLKGRVALVTGGGQNLGYDMAEALAEAGADVAITSRHLDKAQRAAKQLRKRTGRAILPLQLDVTSEEDITRVVRAAIAWKKRLDILVNNAGSRNADATTTAKYFDNGLEHEPLRDWEATMHSYLRGTFLCAKHVLPQMKKQKRGSIINISSISGMVGRQRWVYDGSPGMVGNTTDYSAAKAGVLGFTIDLAAQVGESGIRVNAISPGGFERGQPKEFLKRYNLLTPLGRMGTDGLDMKGAVVYLASDASGYVTAHNLVVDGGFTATK